MTKKRGDLCVYAPLLWNSFGSITALLQEIVSIYPYLSPPKLSLDASIRVCNALTLLQSVASHPVTRISFLMAHIHLYLYPFLNTTSKETSFENLRISSLRVIGGLVSGLAKVRDSEAIAFLLHSEIIPLCLCAMNNGTEIKKTLAVFILQKILLDDVGLLHICSSPDRFLYVCQVLASVVESLAEQPCARLLKYTISCYLRLSEHPRANEILKAYLPDMLKDGTFNDCLREDPAIFVLLRRLLNHLRIAAPRANQQRGLNRIAGN
ncbi:uncharacterized protein [Typha latifolia]|uniref:uncharacterized protein n=1 Tax=Typha latifolia TaxID=4733 RepID=UPI003C2E779B